MHADTSHSQCSIHVVVGCKIYKAPGGFAGLRRPDVATRSWLEDLNIEI